MAFEIIMPKMGESITEGTIIEWKKKVGDFVSKDETLLEISTDKVDTEVPSSHEGVLIKILGNPNDTIEVGAVIGYIGDKNEEVESSNTSKEDNQEASNSIDQDHSIHDQEAPMSSKNDEKIKSNRFYSPLVRSMAKREKIELSELDSIDGTGRGGRVNKADVINYLENRISTSKRIETQPTVSSSRPEGQSVEMDPVRKRIAHHMIQSQETSAHVYSTIEIDMTNLLEIINRYKSSYKEKYNIKLTVTSLIIDACIKALHEFPLLNSSIKDEHIISHPNINMGVAVALEDNNLIVPVIKASEELNLIGLSRALGDLSSKARSNKLLIDDVQGSTFTITNPGVFGGLFGMPIINQPNVGILSIGKIQKKPIVKETESGDSILIRSMMYATLGYDHRLIDGAYGTKFLALLLEIIESYNIDK